MEEAYNAALAECLIYNATYPCTNNPELVECPTGPCKIYDCTENFDLSWTCSAVMCCMSSSSSSSSSSSEELSSSSSSSAGLNPDLYYVSRSWVCTGDDYNCRTCTLIPRPDCWWSLECDCDLGSTILVEAQYFIDNPTVANCTNEPVPADQCGYFCAITYDPTPYPDYNSCMDANYGV
jgi:hypothetical protein